MCFAACYMSYVGFQLAQQDGKWPSGPLAAVLVWVLKSGMGYMRRNEKALWGLVQIFGTPLGPERGAV